MLLAGGQGVSPPMLMVLAGLLTHPQAHVRGAAAAGLKGLARCFPLQALTFLPLLLYQVHGTVAGPAPTSPAGT